MMRRLPHDERPRERLLAGGSTSLSLRELLAVLIGTGPRRIGCLGVARRIMARAGGHRRQIDEEMALFNALDTDPGMLVGDIHGLGPAGQARLLAAYELARRYRTHQLGVQTGDGPRAVTSDHVSAAALARVGPRRRAAVREWFGFVPLFESGKVGQLSIVAQGGRHAVDVDAGEFLARVLSLKPRGVVVFHNHPSGRLRASPHDRELTRRLKRLLSACGVTLVAHWIVTADDVCTVGDS